MSQFYSESAVIESLNEGQYEQAVDLWRMVRGKKGICCDLSLIDKRCILCLEGRLLFLALQKSDVNYEALHRNLRDWREKQAIYS